MAQEDTGKTGSITVVLLGSCKANTPESKGSYVLNGNDIQQTHFSEAKNTLSTTVRSGGVDHLLQCGEYLEYMDASFT